MRLSAEIATTAQFAALAFGLAARSAAAEAPTYVVDPERSAITIHVGRAGLLKFAGHEHEILAPGVQGEVRADAMELGRSSVSVVVDATALQVSGRGEPPDDVPKVAARMRGPELLDVERFTRVSFRSTKVEGREVGAGAYELRVTGDLTLHGVTRSMLVPLRVDVSGDTLTAVGSFVIRHSDFGLTPVAVAGVVKVKNEIAIDFRILAAAHPGR